MPATIFLRVILILNDYEGDVSARFVVDTVYPHDYFLQIIVSESSTETFS